MSVLFKLAWRNLWRNKRRTTITVLSVAFGVWLAATFIGTADYSYINMIDSSARMGFGHVTIQPAGYQERPSTKLRMPVGEALLERVRAVEGVDHATVRILGQGMFQTAEKSVGGAYLGLDPKSEAPEFNLFLRALEEGEMFEGTTGRHAIIGRTMADRMNLTLNKKLVLTTMDKTGEVTSELFRVKGIFKTGVDMVDGSFVLFPIDQMKKALGYAPNEATMVSVFASDYRRAEPVQAALAELGGEREALTWRDTQPEMASVTQVDRSMNQLFQVLLGLLIAAGVLNTILMSVLERRREFGMMMAVGMRPRHLASMVLLESMLVGTVGLLLGVLLMAPWAWFLITHGIDLTSTVGADYETAGVLIDPVIRIALYPSTVAMILGGVFTLTVLAGLYPAITAGRVPPVESLKVL